MEFYIDGEKYSLEPEGAIQMYNFGDNVLRNPMTPVAFSNKRFNLTKKDIRIIDKFLEKLRNYWKDNYTKRKFFRGNLQK